MTTLTPRPAGHPRVRARETVAIPGLGGQSLVALIEWNYYNGVVFEGISNLYEVTGLAAYRTYEQAYLDALVASGALNGYAAFVNASLDSFKPATLLLDFADAEYAQVAATPYQTLANDNAKYTLAAVGYNYWHKWSTYSLYTVWLDGLYMGQPFLADIYFKASGDGINNYQDAAYYYTNEGRGVGPFIKAYAEALRRYG